MGSLGCICAYVRMCTCWLCEMLLKKVHNTADSSRLLFSRPLPLFNPCPQPGHTRFYLTRIRDLLQASRTIRLHAAPFGQYTKGAAPFYHNLLLCRSVLLLALADFVAYVSWLIEIFAASCAGHAPCFSCLIFAFLASFASSVTVLCVVRLQCTNSDHE